MPGRCTARPKSDIVEKSCFDCEQDFSNYNYVSVFKKRTFRLNFRQQISFLKFSKKRMNFQNTTRNAKKNDKFGTKYLKTDVNIVISKILFLKPQLEIKF